MADNDVVYGLGAGDILPGGIASGLEILEALENRVDQRVRKGDLFVAVTLITPKTLTKEQRKLLEQLSKVEDTEFTDESFIEKVRNIFG